MRWPERKNFLSYITATYDYNDHSRFRATEALAGHLVTALKSVIDDKFKKVNIKTTEIEE